MDVQQVSDEIRLAAGRVRSWRGERDVDWRLETGEEGKWIPDLTVTLVSYCHCVWTLEDAAKERQDPLR